MISSLSARRSRPWPRGYAGAVCRRPPVCKSISLASRWYPTCSTACASRNRLMAPLRPQPCGVVQGCTVPGGARLIIHVEARAAASSSDHCGERCVGAGVAPRESRRPTARAAGGGGAGCSARCGAGVRQSACQHCLRQSFILSTPRAGAVLCFYCIVLLPFFT